MIALDYLSAFAALLFYLLGARSEYRASGSFAMALAWFLVEAIDLLANRDGSQSEDF